MNLAPPGHMFKTGLAVKPRRTHAWWGRPSSAPGSRCPLHGTLTGVVLRMTMRKTTGDGTCSGRPTRLPGTTRGTAKCVRLVYLLPVVGRRVVRTGLLYRADKTNGGDVALIGVGTTTAKVILVTRTFPPQHSSLGRRGSVRTTKHKTPKMSQTKTRARPCNIYDGLSISRLGGKAEATKLNASSFSVVTSAFLPTEGNCLGEL